MPSAQPAAGFHVTAPACNVGRRIQDSSFRLALGPLSYDMYAGDSWAEVQVRRLESEVAVDEPANASASLVERQCLLLRRRLSRAEMNGGVAGDLPADLLSRCPVDTPRHGWALGLETQRQATWWHPQSRVCIVGVHPGGAELRARLPWYAILRDALSLGGGIVHAGLAALAGQGFLFLAQAGGGKTTALCRLPAPWTVLADDAALVWPDGRGWLASPLPTWSWVLGGDVPRVDMVPWRLSETVRLGQAVTLRQAERVLLETCAPYAAVKPFYMAAAEYPTVFQLRHELKREMFGFAAALARELPVSTLALTKDGEYWPILSGGDA